MNGENMCYKQSVTAVVLRNNKVLLARHTYGAGKDFLIAVSYTHLTLPTKLEV